MTNSFRTTLILLTVLGTILTGAAGCGPKKEKPSASADTLKLALEGQTFRDGTSDLAFRAADASVSRPSSE